MPLSFYNTMTRTVEPFRPIQEGIVKLYTCGPTVYNHAHIGNFRTYAFEDLLRRWLEYRGYQVTQVMNITDIEDKIIREHRRTRRPVSEVTAPFIKGFFEDIDTLRLERAHHYPRATEYVPQMVEIVLDLLDKGIAYRSDDGSIYYAIRRFPGYGRLAHFHLDDLHAGARVKQDEYNKETASDFALWKAWDEDDGDVFWETELGKGRPGWHLECSAMSMDLLGSHFDMHTGGEDNIFPHHENEIAQSEAHTGEPFVNYWLHSRHLLVEDTKMAKSKGNFFTVKEILEKGHPWYALRYLYISCHYRSQLNFTFDGLEMARRTVENIATFLRRVRDDRARGGEATPTVREAVEKARADFEYAMDDDLNASGALAALHTLSGEYNKHATTGGDASLVADLFLAADRVLGLELDRALAEESLAADEQALLDQRQDARKNRDFKRADELRQALLQRGVVLEDTPQGVRWKRTAPLSS